MADRDRIRNSIPRGFKSSWDMFKKAGINSQFFIKELEQALEKELNKPIFREFEKFLEERNSLFWPDSISDLIELWNRDCISRNINCGEYYSHIVETIAFSINSGRPLNANETFINISNHILDKKFKEIIINHFPGKDESLKQVNFWKSQVQSIEMKNIFERTALSVSEKILSKGNKNQPQPVSAIPFHMMNLKKNKEPGFSAKGLRK